MKHKPIPAGSILPMSYKLSLAKPAGPEFPDALPFKLSPFFASFALRAYSASNIQ
jgi:hypothetical protein